MTPERVREIARQQYYMPDHISAEHAMNRIIAAILNALQEAEQNAAPQEDSTNGDYGLTGSSPAAAAQDAGTPRTDAKHQHLMTTYDSWKETYQEMRETARQLERELAAAQKERDLAIAHDRQPYPTAHAYEQVCKALAARDLRIKELMENIEASDEDCAKAEAERDAAYERAAQLANDFDFGLDSQAGLVADIRALAKQGGKP